MAAYYFQNKEEKVNNGADVPVNWCEGSGFFMEASGPY